MLTINTNCVLIGDEKTGKSSILNSYISGKAVRANYEPTTTREYAVEKQLTDGFGHQHRIMLNVVDTGGQKDLDRLRPLCYSEANVFILCFSVVVPSSFQSLMTKWIPEIKRHTDQKKILLFLIGTQSDLRSNTNVLLKLSMDGQSPVPESRAFRLLGKIGAKHYIECSSLTHKNVCKIFDYIMMSSLYQHSQKRIQDDHLVGGKTGHHARTHDKENKKVNLGKKSQLPKMFTRQWSVRKSYKMKRLAFFSCLFN